jgi:ankyrin repeat protein
VSHCRSSLIFYLLDIPVLHVHTIESNRIFLDDPTETELLAFLVNKNPESICVRDPDGHHPVMLAASCRGPQFCKFLIESLPNQDREDLLQTQEFPLVACRWGLPETVQYFIQLFGPKCLRIRSRSIHTNQLQISETSPIHEAVKNYVYSEEITRMLLKLDPTLASFKATSREQHSLPFHIHLGRSHSPHYSVDVIQMLFDAYPDAILVSDLNGKDVSTKIRELLLDTNSYKYRLQNILNFVEKQKEYCTLAHKGDEHLTTPDGHGRLLLHKALADKDVSLGTIKMIVDKQHTAVRVSDYDGLSPLHIASNCTVDILCHVLGFDKSAANKVDNEGNNILHAACKTGNLKAIEYIIDRHGLLASKVNNKGQFPIVTLLDKDGKEGNITKTAEYTGMIMKMLLAYPEFVVPAISV